MTRDRRLSWINGLLLPLFNVLTAFLATGVVFLLIGVDPIEATKILIYGALGYDEGLGYTLYYATNFVFTGLAVAVAFHAGLFNIGGEGQAYVGGLGIALVALYRPGPMGNIAIYNQCKHGTKEPDYLHPKLKKILEPTYGVIIYQEQVMQIAQTLSGFSAGEADILRRAMGKKKRAELEKQKERFVNGATKNGIPKDTAIFIFKKIEPFAEYGFNKSHATAYAMIAYQTAYLKTYHPNEFVAASMSNELSNTDKLSEFFEELKRLEIKVCLPCINKCFAEFVPQGSLLFYALGAIKNVGFEAISQVVQEREKNGKFKSISDFINRVDPKNINKLQLEGLVKAGAFDSIFKNRKVLYDNIPNIIQNSKTIHENRINNQSSLFLEDNHKISYLMTDKDSSSWSSDETLSKEFESVGFYLSNHPN